MSGNEIRPALRKSPRYLEGGDSLLVAYRKDDGGCSFLRPMCSSFPGVVLNAIADEFKTEIISENDYRYWGFATQEEMDARNDELDKASEDAYYRDLLAYVRDELHCLPPGTVGMMQGKIAKTLVDEDPGLMAPENRSVLLDTIRDLYRKHAATMSSTEQELKAAERLMTLADERSKTSSDQATIAPNRPPEVFTKTSVAKLSMRQHLSDREE